MDLRPEPPSIDPRRSVRGRLMRLVLVTTAVAVCVAGAGMLTYDLSVYRSSWVSELASQAAILGISVAPALEFDDREVADRNLAAMQVRASVLVAALYTADGRLYASYTRSAQFSPPAAPPTGEIISGERVELTRAGRPQGGIARHHLSARPIRRRGSPHGLCQYFFTRDGSVSGSRLYPLGSIATLDH